MRLLLLLPLLLSSCGFIEGIRQSDPSYVSKQDRYDRKQWDKKHAKEIADVPELLDLP